MVRAVSKTDDLRSATVAIRSSPVLMKKKMAFSKDKFPTMRLSDIDDLLRENALDSSDGQKLADFIRRKQGTARSRLNRPFELADLPVSFRFEQSRPSAGQQSVQTHDMTVSDDNVLPELASDSVRSPTMSGIGRVHPPQASSRIPSFVTPLKTVPSVSLRSPQRNENLISSRGSPVPRLWNSNRNPSIRKISVEENLNRKTLVKECQRANTLKCELLRSLKSSTPNPGDRQCRMEENFMNIRETISPISDERSGVSEHPIANVNRADPVQGRLNSTVPATQDQPDAVERNARECTPPVPDGEHVIIPETPSPVRRSSRSTGSPFIALGAYRSPVMKSATRRQTSFHTPQQQLQVNNAAKHNNGGSPSQLTSILKRRSTNPSTDQSLTSPSTQNRVNFSHQLYEVREISPAYVRSPQPACLTSDESSEDDMEELPEAQHRPESPSLQMHNRKLMRSVAIDRPSVLASGEDKINEIQDNEPFHQQMPPVGFRRRSLSFDDIIRNGVMEKESTQAQPNEVASPKPIAQTPPDQQLSTNRAELATNEQQGVDEGPNSKRQTRIGATDMVMEGSNGSESSSSDGSCTEEGLSSVPSPGSRRASHRQTIASPMSIANIDSPRTVMKEIIEPPSAFCDQEPEATENVAQLVPCDEQQQQKRIMQTRKRGNAAPPTAEMNDQTTEDNRKSVVNPIHRAKSITSPLDHVPLEMLNAVDMIHTQSSAAVPPASARAEADDLRETFVFPMKKRRMKSMVDDFTKNYFETVARVCDHNERKSKKRSFERRRLFATDASRAGGNIDDLEENFTSPEPLPATQEDEEVALEQPDPDAARSNQSEDESQADPTPSNQPAQASAPQSVAQEKVQQVLKLRSLAIIVERLAVACIPSEKEKRKDAKTMETQPGTVVSGVSAQEEHSVETSKESSGLTATFQEMAGEHEREEQQLEQENTDPSDPVERSQPARKKKNAAKEVSKDAAGKKQSKKRSRKKQRIVNDCSDDSDSEKDFRFVFNKMQQQDAGLRRSKRTRTLSKMVLFYNPDISAHDAPLYRMPTVKEVLAMQTELASKMKRNRVKKHYVKSKTTTTTKSASQNNKPAKDVPRRVCHVEGDSDGADVRNGPVTASAEDDHNGFSVPVVSSATVSGKEAAPSQQQHDGALGNNEDDASAIPVSASLRNGLMYDSGLSSDAMTNDEATKTLPNPRQRHRPADSQPTEDGKSSSDGVEHDPIVSAKREAMDWMMKLMGSSANRKATASMVSVDINGFSHCSIDHLTFQRRGNIEYSFYVYSDTDNFGFIRFLPNAKKKMGHADSFSLKFLILRGTLTFNINGQEVHASGGDFLMLSPGSKYNVINGPDVSLMFVMKSTISGAKKS